VCVAFPYFRFVEETVSTQTPATLDLWFLQNLVGINKGPYWPVHPTSRVVGWKNISAGIETSPGLMGGCYIQGIGKIVIGDYTQIASNVGIISANHALSDSRVHTPEGVRIGAYCWIGMGAIVLPGVTLGDFTVVGAGSIVTKSFPDGYAVVAGNPARVVKQIDSADCVRHRSPHEYHGFIPADRFDDFKSDHLNL
jgi:acetyltransferase-like isoleucine patch superfamily enzyme